MHEELRGRLQGAECVFQERGLFLVVRVVRAYVWFGGVTLRLAAVSTPGTPEVPGEIKVDATWECLAVSPSLLSAAYVGWSLYLDPEAVNAVRETARGFPPGISPRERYEAFCEAINRLPT